jgi:hypothetical protein
MSHDAKQEWAVLYNKGYQGLEERNAFKVVRPDKGIKSHDTLTRLEYKEEKGTFLKRKVRLCAKGDQQIEGGIFKSSDLYTLILKDPEARLLAEIAAEHSCQLLKTDTAGIPLPRNGRR